MGQHSLGQRLGALKRGGLEAPYELCVSKLIELLFKGELHCLQGCFRKQTGKEDT